MIWEKKIFVAVMTSTLNIISWDEKLQKMIFVYVEKVDGFLDLDFV